MGQLCTKCVQLLYDFAVSVKTLLSGVLRDIRECLAEIADCPCLKRKNVEMRWLYKPVLHPYEEETAQDFLQHIERGFEMSSLGKISLEALKTLAFSDHSGLQMLAALYYLHISQDLNIQLSQEHLETYYALLKSNDLEVQQISSLSLLSFLLEGNGEWITKNSLSEKVECNTCLKLTKEHVIEMDLLEPILELLESDDINIQGNSCACLMMLADSEACRNAIAAAGGTIPLLSLSKSHDIGVQQNAVQAIFNLTGSEWIQRVLVRQSALPILTRLLESPDTEVQYYSCAALSNVATNSQHHKAMLHVGDRFLLQTLLSLLSSGVNKISNQACICLRNLATNEFVLTSLVAMQIQSRLLPLLTFSNKEIQQNSVILLQILSQHPGNQDALMSDEMLQALGELLLTWRTDPVIVGHMACLLKNLSLSKNIQKILESPCIKGLLQAIHSAHVLDDSLFYVISCLAELVKHEGATVHIVALMDEPWINHLVKLANEVEQTELSFQAAFLIKHFVRHEEVVTLLKTHMNQVQQYLMKYLIHREIRFQHLGITTLCALQKDPDFLAAFSSSELKKHLDEICQQTEIMQELLSVAIGHMEA
ncbi:vacuolar protein 8-like isoform X1 [Crotalus tigris]|uniref:vacuolar protein 8-like isoform X1 n=1 Tax=Crotalus tigris TaxID=88082 RepID=UPI00192FAE80|nr:vacuolar protein 8-like isoform X1 [Crotalus tigris]